MDVGDKNEALFKLRDMRKLSILRFASIFAVVFVGSFITAVGSIHADDVWSNEIMMIDSPLRAAGPAIALDPDGDIHAAWSEKIGADYYELYHTKLTNVGDTLVPKRKLTDGDTKLGALKMAIDLRGNVHLIFRDNTSAKQLYYMKLDNNGTLTGEIRNIINNSNAFWIGVDSHDNVHITWRKCDKETCKYFGEGYDFYYTKLDNNGTTAVPPKKLTTDLDVCCGKFRIDSDGDIHIVLDATNKTEGSDNPYNLELYYIKLNGSTGNEIVNPKRLTYDNGAYSCCPNIAVDSNGYVHITWFDDRDYPDDNLYNSTDNIIKNTEIYYTKLNNTGYTVVPDKRITYRSGRSEDPLNAIDSDGNLHVVWWDGALWGSSKLYYVKLNNTGDDVTDHTVLRKKGPGSGQIIVDFDGNAYVVYRQSGPDKRVYLKRSFVAPINMTSPKNTTYTTSSVDLNYSLVPFAIDWVGYSLDGRANVTTSGEVNSFSNLGGGDLGTATNITFDQAGSNTSVYIKIPKNTTVYSASMGGRGGNKLTLQLQDPDTENLADTYVDVGDSLNSNFGTSSEMYLGQASDSNSFIGRIYIKFNISLIPSGKIITDARLYSYNSFFNGDFYVPVYHGIDYSWNNTNETTITGNNQPCGINFDNSAMCNLTPEDTSLSSYGWINWSVTNSVKREYDTGDKNVSFVLYNDSADGNTGYPLIIYSKEYTSNTSLRPYLNITYVDVPIPTNPSIDTANDGIIDWSMAGELDSTNSPQTVDLNITAINDYVSSRHADADGFVYVPLTISSDSDGIVQLDALSVKYYFNATLTPLSEGEHNVTVYTNDTYGNMKSSTIYFIVDTVPVDTPPTITLTTPQNTTITYTTPDLNLTTDELADITYSWNGEGNISGCRNCMSFNTTYGEYANSSEQNLSAIWHFNENTGTTLFDETANDNDGVITGATYQSGKFGYGLKFDGNGDFVNISYDDTLDVLDGNTPFTFATWFKLDELPSVSGSANTLFSQADGVGTGRTWLVVTPTDNVKTWLGGSQLTSNSVLAQDQWYFVVLNYNGSVLEMYINGTFDTSTTTTVNESADGEYHIGTKKVANGAWFNGTIDEVILFDRNLSSAEIQGLYSRTLPEGQHSVTGYANDTAGNMNSSTVYFTLDTTPPTYSNLTPPNNGYTNYSGQDISIVIMDEGSDVNAGSLSMTVAGDYHDTNSGKLDYDMNSGLLTYYADDGEFNGGQVVYVVVNAEDNAGNQIGVAWNFMVTSTEYNISLNTGWNLISIPLEQDNWTITSVLASIEGKYNVVFEYRDGGWKRSTARSPLTDMSLQYGYWINMSESAMLELTGTVPSVTTINVNTGWNLVGYPSPTVQNLTIVLSPISYTVVFEYRDGGWKSTTTRNPLTEMTPGYGYWVNATEAGSYEVGN